LLWTGRASADDGSVDSLSFGLVTDVHYADIPAKGTRCYRDSQAKLVQAVETFNRRGLPFVAELGDFIDAGPSKADELKYLHAIREVFAQLQGQRYYVLGNHCVQTLTKTEFLENCGAELKKNCYSFDHGRFHFVVLDANFKRDGSSYAAGDFVWTDTWIHKPQQRWLAEDLERAADKTTVVFVHQNLDNEQDPHGVKNAPEIRSILENSGNVSAVFQGHRHTGGYRKIAGIHYCTLRAMVEGLTTENNAYAIVTLGRHRRITLEGFAQQGPVAFD
jgi:alkaline phosphatase